ncbi:hypothetical protein NEUTE1DRAFT_118729 [Neurospora tetrasperma FGSC 2508]|uniref:Uncharacterized protein n=1 Tax=Neurospora tetrasperma (strain FGSC 2508 / ATCC MYA-4615 / P0657) TaxID=510951 RepID=F8N1I9_NEUT8|nr:uncharacterized protein NEUTE1DRAFT_118729 [Neurospora tetrasperma FGSC 2508]EGO52320.1 hypothetical protein NEUTE1DRAFT_118729 [Neurospora tetrasperma FGSC 2508]
MRALLTFWRTFSLTRILFPLLCLFSPSIDSLTLSIKLPDAGVHLGHTRIFF